MAKTIIEELMSLLSPQERVALQSKLDANPRLIERDKKSAEVYTIYEGGEPEPEPVVTTPAATTSTPASASVSSPAPVTAAATTSAPATADSNAAILAELQKLSSTFDAKLDAFKKEFIPAADLAKHRGEVTAAAIKAADDLAQIRESHRSEFGKPLDRDAFEKFVTDQQAAGTRFKDLRAAHDLFVTKERTDAEVNKRVDEQVKQKKSAESVPGQTQSVAMSPALAVMKKAREAAKGGDGKSNAMAAAEKLAALERGREDSVGAIQ